MSAAATALVSIFYDDQCIPQAYKNHGWSITQCCFTTVQRKHAGIQAVNIRLWNTSTLQQQSRTQNETNEKQVTTDMTGPHKLSECFASQ